jgi:hypothetical protein
MGRRELYVVRRQGKSGELHLHGVAEHLRRAAHCLHPTTSYHFISSHATIAWSFRSPCFGVEVGVGAVKLVKFFALVLRLYITIVSMGVRYQKASQLLLLVLHGFLHVNNLNTLMLPAMHLSRILLLIGELSFAFHVRFHVPGYV